MVPEPAFNVGHLNALYAKVEYRMIIAILVMAVISLPLGVYFIIQDDLREVKDLMDEMEERVRLLERSKK